MQEGGAATPRQTRHTGGLTKYISKWQQPTVLGNFKLFSFKYIPNILKICLNLLKRNVIWKLGNSPCIYGSFRNASAQTKWAQGSEQRSMCRSVWVTAQLYLVSEQCGSGGSLRPGSLLGPHSWTCPSDLGTHLSLSLKTSTAHSM